MREIISPLDGLRSPFGFIRGGGVVPFSPSTLFASGEEGAWYEPSTTTAFTATATGTNGFTDIAPAGYGDLCAILLDKSQGAGYSGGSFTGLGSELLGDQSASEWVTYANNTVADAPDGGVEITFVDNAFGAYLNLWKDQAFGYFEDTSKIWIIEFEARVTGGSCSVRIQNLNQNLTLQGLSSTEYVTLRFTGRWDGGGAFLLDAANLGAGEKLYYRNISVRELPGNHATQATESARPILARVPSTGRRNLLERTEEFDNAVWVKSGVTVSANTATDPFGGSTADLIYPLSSGSNRWVYQAYSSTLGIYTRSVYAKASGKNFLFIDPTGAGTVAAYFDLSLGQVGTVSSGYTATIASIWDGWYRCSVKNNSNQSISFGGVYGVADADNSRAVTSNSTDGIYLWGAQIEVAT